jgi:WD40 repeat protein
MARSGEFLASVRDSDGAVQTWAAPSAKVERLPSDVAASDLAISPDGSRLATGGKRGLALWNALSRERLARHDSSPSAPAQASPETGATGGAEDPPHPTALAFREDGAVLASGDSDHRVRLWDAKSLALLRVFPGTVQGTITCLAFGPDGSVVATASEDGTVRLWRSADGAELRTLAHAGSWNESLSPNAVWGVAFDSSGTRIATACSDRYVRIWGVRATALPK